MKYYIATKLENHAEHNRVRDLLNANGDRITYDWTYHGPVYSSGLARIAEVASLETHGVLDADYIVVLWPGGRGTHVELGIALGANIPVVFFSDHDAHHEASPETCAFYHHRLVERTRTRDELFAAISKVRQQIASER